MTGATFSSTHYQEYQETGDKNIFEEVIEMMILEGVAGMNNSTRNLLKSMPTEKKRTTMLGLLTNGSSSHIQMFNKIKGLLNKDISRLEHIKDIIMLLRDYVKVGDVEQKKFGEVMTPLELVKEMLNTLPEEIWSNPETKILDPSGGTGVYPMVAIYKLMKGLVEWEPNEEKRYRHIVENMIYACELQPKNTFLYLCAIDPFDQYDVNVYTGSFLDEGFDYHMKNVWGVSEYTLSTTNPPYQSSSDDIRSSKSIYNIFVEKSFGFSQNVLMVTPSRWFSNGNMEEFRSKMIGKFGLKILKECDPSIFPTVEIKGGVSYFLLEKGYIGDVLYNGKNVIFNDLIIPSEVNNIIKKLGGCESISESFYSGSYFNIETNDSRLGGNGIVCHVSKKNGTTKKIDDEKVKEKVNYGSYKLLIPSASGTKNSIGELGRFVISMPGEVCSSSFVHFVCKDERECLNMVSYFQTELIKFLIRIKKPTQRVSKDTFSFVPSVSFEESWSNDRVKKYFNLSEEDLKFIVDFGK